MWANLLATTVLSLLPFILVACKQTKPPAVVPGPMPVQVSLVALTAIPISDTYIATIKGRRSSTMQPQVDGNITKILVVSGQSVTTGQILMQIDPLRQVATVQSQVGLEAQQKAVYEYNQAELERQKKLFEAGVTSRQVYDQAIQAFENSKGAFTSSSASTNTQREQLAYYQIRAPFAGIIGDVPVHVGDYVSATTVLTTVDDNSGLEAYIYLPTERAPLVRNGLPVQLLDTSGAILAASSISFISPQVDNGLQGILAKAPVPQSSQRLRTGQLVNARITWNTSQSAVIPVLAVTRIGGQTFVYLAIPKGAGYVAHQVAVTVGDTLGNNYPVLSGLSPGDRVILSGIQFLGEGAPVQPLS